MKKVILFLIGAVLLLQCKKEVEPNKGTDTVFKHSFRKYDELDFLRGYTKVRDTSIWAGDVRGPSHRVTHFQKNTGQIIVFSKVKPVNNDKEEIRVLLDTLEIFDLEAGEYITIGYCYNNKDFEEQIIAVVDSTENDTIENIKRMWKADLVSEKIRPIADSGQFTCFREYSLGFWDQYE